ncbi:MAG TPA: DUF2062 domain-containing protein [Verrucomicrobiae bacterium]|nr:DUF2062 domain-containing protein [Verrucomicrobiae bacterium]
MKYCVLIPCFNHSNTVAAVARDAQPFAPVIVVDDGSTQPLPELPGCEIIRLEKNSGKGAALRVGFRRAMERGFTHAITMDADGQHFAEDLPGIISAAQSQPEALIVGIRDIRKAGAVWHRQISNAVSNFWFRVETRVPLRDTQCGFRCYSLALAERLKTKSGRYAFELEFMVRASWIGTPLVPAPVKCTYASGNRNSHFRPVVDLARITRMNFVLVVQSLLLPRHLRALWSLGQKESWRDMLRDFFSENSHDPLRLALAVGVGLFCGIAPIWGFQMVATIGISHWLRLNKAIALIASNISIPPVVPFVLYGELVLGRWMMTGKSDVDFSVREMTWAHVREYAGQWCVGSLALAIALAIAGTAMTYGLARLWRHK